MHKALPLTLLIAASWMAGCDQIEMGRSGELTVPPGTISVHSLAGRLGMRVDQSSRSLASLSSRTDRVLVVGRPGSRVYVNGQPVGPVGHIKAVEDVLFVPLDMELDILAALGGDRPIPGTRDSQTARRDRQRRVGPLEKVEPAHPAPVHGTVVLDPGHGGKDPGAASNGIREKDLNLTVAQLVGEDLAKRGAKVLMTRDTDIFIELDDRPAVSNRAGADLFVSLHANSIPKPSVSGFEVYVENSASSASIAAAMAIASRLQEAGIYPYGPQPKRKAFRVLTHNRRPSVLVEMGFLTNSADAARLLQSEYQKRLAVAIADGIADFLRSR